MLLLEGVLSVVIGGEVIAEVAAGAVLGERVALGDGRRMAYGVRRTAYGVRRTAYGDPAAATHSVIAAHQRPRSAWRIAPSSRPAIDARSLGSHVTDDLVAPFPLAREQR
jgi:hypothetical protein